MGPKLRGGKYGRKTRSQKASQSQDLVTDSASPHATPPHPVKKKARREESGQSDLSATMSGSQPQPVKGKFKIIWSDAMEEKLMELYEENPALYDMTHPQYRDVNVRAMLRKKIAAKMNLPGEKYTQKIWAYLCSIRSSNLF